MSDRWGFRVAVVRKVWVACFCAFLFLRITIAPFTSASNRFFFHWQRTDAVAILGLVVLLGLFLYAGHFMVSAAGRWGKRVANLAFVAFTAFYLKVACLEIMFPSSAVPGWLAILGKVLVVGVVGGACLYPVRVVGWLRAVCLIVSPVVVMFAGTLLVSEPCRPSNVPVENSGSEEAAAAYSGRIVWICLDGCSYERMFPDGPDAAPTPGVFKRLAGQSYVFHQAYSPGNATFQSIPQILMGVSGWVVLDGSSGLAVERESRRDSFALVPNIFQAAKTRGMTTGWYSYYLPAEAFAGPAVDTVESICAFKPLGKSMGLVGLKLLLQHLSTRLGEWVPAFRQVQSRVIAQHAAAYDGWIHRKAMASCREADNEFVFFHYRTPHEPFIHDRNGGLMDPAVSQVPALDAYQGAMEHVDRVIGQVLDHLDTDNTNRRTMLVVFADHTFREDPDLPDRPDPRSYQRVPLFIHVPGQTRQVNITRPVELVDLVDWMKQFMDTGKRPWEQPDTSFEEKP